MNKLLFSLLLLLSFPISAKQVVLSEKPISIHLPIKKELIVKFPQAVTHTSLLNEQDATVLSTLLSPEGILYMTAVEGFEPSRMVAELVDGRLVMLDVSASDLGPFDSEITITEKPTIQETDPAQIQVIHEKPEKNPYLPDFLKDGEAKTLNSARDAASNVEALQYHVLVQQAFRQYVGPARLAGGYLGQEIKVNTAYLDRLIRLNDGRLKIALLKSWKNGDYYVTVLLVNNLSHDPIAFDPRAIRGRWVFAAALHPVLAPSGMAEDRTLWALISKVPFEKAR